MSMEHNNPKARQFYTPDPTSLSDAQQADQSGGMRNRRLQRHTPRAKPTSSKRSSYDRLDEENKNDNTDNVQNRQNQSSWEKTIRIECSPQ